MSVNGLRPVVNYREVLHSVESSSMCLAYLHYLRIATGTSRNARWGEERTSWLHVSSLPDTFISRSNPDVAVVLTFNF